MPVPVPSLPGPGSGPGGPLPGPGNEDRGMPLGFVDDLDEFDGPLIEERPRGRPKNPNKPDRTDYWKKHYQERNKDKIQTALDKKREKQELAQ